MIGPPLIPVKKAQVAKAAYSIQKLPGRARLMCSNDVNKKAATQDPN